MNHELQGRLRAALERPHRLGMIGGDLEEQLAHCASFSSVLAEVPGPHHGDAGMAVDLGTGGGLPGVALAVLWTQLQWILVDMRVGRATEVERSILHLRKTSPDGADPVADRVVVEAQEAQHIGHDPRYREQSVLVVARAFGPASLTAECASALLKIGGTFVVSEPPDTQQDRWNEAALERLGLTVPHLVVAGDHHFAVLTKLEPSPTNVPRLPPRPKRGWFGHAS